MDSLALRSWLHRRVPPQGLLPGPLLDFRPFTLVAARHDGYYPPGRVGSPPAIPRSAAVPPRFVILRPGSSFGGRGPGARSWRRRCQRGGVACARHAARRRKAGDGPSGRRDSRLCLHSGLSGFGRDPGCAGPPSTRPGSSRLRSPLDLAGRRLARWPLHLLVIPALAAISGGAALWDLVGFARRVRSFLPGNRRLPQARAAPAVNPAPRAWAGRPERRTSARTRCAFEQRY